MSSKTFLINDKKIIEWRKRFSLAFQEILDSNRLDQVYWLDESYVHQVIKNASLFAKKKSGLSHNHGCQWR